MVLWTYRGHHLVRHCRRYKGHRFVRYCGRYDGDHIVDVIRDIIQYGTVDVTIVWDFT